MISFPFFRFRYPSFYYPYYNNYIKHSQINSAFKEDLSNNHVKQISDLNKYDKEQKEKQSNKKINKKNSKYSSFGPIHFNNDFLDGNLEEPLIEILGISLYLDDLIILGLLFILYKEDVQDEILFISLILLLLSWLTDSIVLII